MAPFCAHGHPTARCFSCLQDKSVILELDALQAQRRAVDEVRRRQCMARNIGRVMRRESLRRRAQQARQQLPLWPPVVPR